MYHSVVGMLNDLAGQVESELDLTSAPSEELSDITNQDVVDKLREVAEEGRGAADAVHAAAHKQGGALNFGDLRAWQDEASLSMMLSHTALMGAGIQPLHSMPSFQR